jgi:hypothetical protein
VGNCHHANGESSLVPKLEKLFGVGTRIIAPIAGFRKKKNIGLERKAWQAR